MEFISRAALQYKFYRVKNLDISAAEASLVRFVAKFDGVAQDKITRRMRTNKSNIARLLKSLERKEYIYREVNQEDRRNLIVYPTEKGRKAFKYIWKIDGEWLDYLRTSLTTEEAEIFQTLLKKVCIRASEWESHPFSEIFYDENEMNITKKEREIY